jgi:hypothetical protein
MHQVVNCPACRGSSLDFKGGVAQIWSVMATRWARFVRGWIAAVFATLVAVVLHTLGGGAVPGIVAIALSLAFASLACIALSGKTLSAWRLAVAVGFSQFLFHGVFSTLGTTSPVAAASHHIHGIVPFLATSSPAPHAEHWMLPAHVAAALVTFIALRYGERAFWGLRTTARLFLATLLRAIAPIRIVEFSSSRDRTDGAPALRELGVFLTAVRYRGPPATSLLA